MAHCIDYTDMKTPCKFNLAYQVCDNGAFLLRKHVITVQTTVNPCKDLREDIIKPYSHLAKHLAI